MKDPRILAFIGSARLGGNTETLVGEALRGARDVGATTGSVRLSDFTIRPCLGCLECLERGECVQRDDFAALRARMIASPVWLLGTPVYVFAPSGQLKLLLDRWISIPRNMTEGKRAVGIVALENSTAETARTTVEVLEHPVRDRRMAFAGTVVAPGLANVGDARKRPEYLAAAYHAGKDAAALLHMD